VNPLQLRLLTTAANRVLTRDFKETMAACVHNDPALAPAFYVALNRQAESALARFAGVSVIVSTHLAVVCRPFCA
jgi:hypothetical protein